MLLFQVKYYFSLNIHVFFRHSRQLLAAVRIGCVGRARGPRPEGDGHARLLHRWSIPGTFEFNAKTEFQFQRDATECASFMRHLQLSWSVRDSQSGASGCERGFVNFFLIVRPAYLGSSGAAAQPNDLWNSRKTFYKTLFTT